MNGVYKKQFLLQTFSTGILEVNSLSIARNIPIATLYDIALKGYIDIVIVFLQFVLCSFMDAQKRLKKSRAYV